MHATYGPSNPRFSCLLMAYIDPETPLIKLSYMTVVGDTVHTLCYSFLSRSSTNCRSDGATHIPAAFNFFRSLFTRKKATPAILQEGEQNSVLRMVPLNSP